MQKLAERIDGLENVERRASDGVSLAEEDLFAEIAERESRASNIIMFSLDEPEHSDSNDVSDKDLVNDVLHTILPSLEPSYKVRRLGVKKHGQPRPLCVSFSSKQEAILVLRNKGKYTGPAKIYQDQTPKQRKYLMNLRAHLRELQDAGESKTIRYIGGVPKIVNANQPMNSKNV
ncbi:hypothetical protein X777_11808 [Ooceraea biroi]|uniref:Uncharacterized protein n=1 Tax=Ooceraea biroi TaxID=2015173 RepID=A0A026W187_OOCBI|nr:hypothetical protein X777_11808 [Ooceraea biroi]